PSSASRRLRRCGLPAPRRCRSTRSGRWSSTASTCSGPRMKRGLPLSDARGAISVSSEPLRMAVIGVGHLGRHHARILSATEGARLVAVVDTAADRATQAAATTGARALSDFRELLGDVDAVTVAVPTELHRDVALPFLERGTAVLIEKPIARSLAEADE